MAKESFDEWIERLHEEWWTQLSPLTQESLLGALEAEDLAPSIAVSLIESRCPIGPVGTRWENQTEYAWSWNSRTHDFLAKKAPKPSAYEDHGLDFLE